MVSEPFRWVRNQSSLVCKAASRTLGYTLVKALFKFEKVKMRMN